MCQKFNAHLFRDFVTVVEASISILDATRKIALPYSKLNIWSEVIDRLGAGRKSNRVLSKSGFITLFAIAVIF